ncbi:MAG: transposase [Deltaproteobacteria bacterium]|nr:transposase [Deltaproteobacteria bacterium]
MTKPRPIEKGATYLLTRRCFQRQFLLAPSALTNQIVTYCLGIAAERYGIDLHAFCFMSTHYHLVATDPRGELPEFMRWLNEFIAKREVTALRASRLGKCSASPHELRSSLL